MLLAPLLPLSAHAAGDEWADFATVSMTNPTTPKLSANRLCYTDGRDIACDGAAGLLVTSGTLAIPNISATALTVNGVPITGSASGDRITSGTAGVFANMMGGYVSLTTGATTWGYLGSSATYLPTLGVGGNISSTSISTTVAQIASRTVASIAGSGGNYIVSGTTSVSTSSAGSITFVTASSQRMVIDSSGRVGIGTATPSRALQVVGGGVEIIADTNAGTSWAVFGAAYNGLRKAYFGYYPNSGTNGVLQIATEASDSLALATNSAQRMLITGSGNVGIGTVNPTRMLDVNGTVNVTNGVIARGATNYPGADLGLYSGVAGNWIRFVTNNAPFEWSTDNAGASARMHLSQAGVLIVYGTSTCSIGDGTGATNCTSDRRLKKDITPISSALEKVKMLNGVTFHWKDPKKSGVEHIGVIAQDVEKVFPQAVGEVSDTTLGAAKTVDIAALVAPLIEAVKELNADNDNLRLLVDHQAEQLKAEQASKAGILRRLEALERGIH